jgi:hypothetical protein
MKKIQCPQYLVNPSIPNKARPTSQCPLTSSTTSYMSLERLTILSTHEDTWMYTLENEQDVQWNEYRCDDSEARWFSCCLADSTVRWWVCLEDSMYYQRAVSG